MVPVSRQLVTSPRDPDTHCIWQQKQTPSILGVHVVTLYTWLRSNGATITLNA